MPTKRAASGAVKTLREFVKKCKESRKNHPSTAKKKRKKAKRDPAWFGQKKRHKKAAKKGHLAAATNFAEMTMQGEGVKRDPQEAFELYRKVAARQYGRAMVGLYCAAFAQVPKRIVLDIDDTFDAVHGGQQLRLFNAHYDEYGFQPIVVFDGAGRFVSAVLRPAKRPSGAEIRAHLRRLVRAIRSNWPNTRILIRADGHYCSPLVIDWCRANDVDFILGLAPTTTLRKHVADLETSTTARFNTSAKTGKVRRFKEFVDGAASWSRVERIIARVEVGGQGADSRFVATNLAGGKAKALYEDVYCRRGAAENHIKSWKTHLAADRTSCSSATANQFRLFLHAGAYWLMWGLRAAMPKRSSFAVAQFDTLRLRLIKIAARVVEMKTQIRLHLPTSCPDQRILRIVLSRIPRLAT